MGAFFIPCLLLFFSPSFYLCPPLPLSPLSHSLSFFDIGLGRSKFLPKPLPQEINMLLSECDIGCYSDASEKSSAPTTASALNAKGDSNIGPAAVYANSGGGGGGGSVGGGGYIDGHHANSIGDDDDDDDNRIG